MATKRKLCESVYMASEMDTLQRIVYEHDANDTPEPSDCRRWIDYLRSVLLVPQLATIVLNYADPGVNVVHQTFGGWNIGRQMGIRFVVCTGSSAANAVARSICTERDYQQFVREYTSEVHIWFELDIKPKAEIRASRLFGDLSLLAGDHAVDMLTRPCESEFDWTEHAPHGTWSPMMFYLRPPGLVEYTGRRTAATVLSDAVAAAPSGYMNRTMPTTTLQELLSHVDYLSVIMRDGTLWHNLARVARLQPSFSAL